MLQLFVLNYKYILLLTFSAVLRVPGQTVSFLSFGIEASPDKILSCKSYYVALLCNRQFPLLRPQTRDESELCEQTEHSEESI